MKKYLFLFFFFAQFFSDTVNSQTLAYEYDALGRLVQVEDGVNGNRIYDYDAAGNRKSLTRPIAKAPVISPGGGSFNNFQTITLSTQTAGAEIYYTLNNTVPTTSSPRYTGPFLLSSSATIRAIAIKFGFINSTESTANFSYTVTTPTISPNGGSWPSPTTVTLATATSGASITTP